MSYGNADPITGEFPEIVDTEEVAAESPDPATVPAPGEEVPDAE
jgi:hypothetical protein